MKLHHTGYITGDIDGTANVFEVLGYRKCKTYDDINQKCFICFLERESGEPLVELVKPYDDNIQMQKILKKKGVSPYHLCFEVEDVQKIYEELSSKDGWIPIFEPIEAVAFNNRKITYFMNYEAGFIEFVNEK